MRAIILQVGLGYSDRRCLASPAAESRWSFAAFALLSPFPCHLPDLTYCPISACSAIFTVGLTFPGFVRAPFPETIKSRLSLVSKLAYQWPLQNFSVPSSVMRCSRADISQAKCTPVCLLDCARVPPMSLPVPVYFLRIQTLAPLASRLPCSSDSLTCDPPPAAQPLLRTCGNASWSVCRPGC